MLESALAPLRVRPRTDPDLPERTVREPHALIWNQMSTCATDIGPRADARWNPHDEPHLTLDSECLMLEAREFFENPPDVDLSRSRKDRVDCCSKTRTSLAFAVPYSSKTASELEVVPPELLPLVRSEIEA